MGSVVRSCFVIVVVFCVAQIGQGAGQLDVNYYIKTCPQVQKIVASEFQKAFKSDPRSAASLLKLHFSDCFVNGCDASVLLDDTKDFKGEKNATPSYKSSARGYEVIDNIKSEVEKACPSVVSCADILTLAAKESVAVMEGSVIGVVVVVIVILGLMAGVVGRMRSRRSVMGRGNYDLEAWVESKCSTCIDGRVDHPLQQRKIPPTPLPSSSMPAEVGGQMESDVESSDESLTDTEHRPPPPIEHQKYHH